MNLSLLGEETSCTRWGLKQLPRIQVNPSLQGEEQTVPAGYMSSFTGPGEQYQQTEEQGVPAGDYSISPGVQGDLLLETEATICT